MFSARHYLPKGSEPEEVVKTIEAVYVKGFHYNNEVIEIIRENMLLKDKLKANFFYELTSREKEILQLKCEQYTTPEISKSYS